MKHEVLSEQKETNFKRTDGINRPYSLLETLISGPKQAGNGSRSVAERIRDRRQQANQCPALINI